MLSSIDKLLDFIAKIDNQYKFIVFVAILPIIVGGIFYLILKEILPNYLALSISFIISGAIFNRVIELREKEHIKQKELLEGKIKELEKQLEIERQKKEQEIYKAEKAKYESEKEKIKVIEKIPERMRRFLMILNEKKHIDLKSIEEEIYKRTKLAIILLSTNETIMTSENKKYKTLQKQIKDFLIDTFENYKEVGGTSLFAKFMYLKAKEETNEIDRFYRLDIKGMSAFIVIPITPKDIDDATEIITTIRNKIIERYRAFVEEIIKFFENSKYYGNLSKEDKKLWREG